MNENHNQLPASANTAKLLCRCLAVMTLIGQLVQAASPSTAFTYQGRLFIGDVPANGLYDLQFTNYDASTGGNVLGGFNTNALPVTNGLFTVTLDFGAVFDGTPRWLEISERTNGVGAFGTLAPRQLLAAAPYATYAASAGTVPGLTILQNADGAPNVIGGSPANWVAGGTVGATIAGGGATNYNGNFSFNSISSDFGTISGGSLNTIQTDDHYATIGGGYDNVIWTGAGSAVIGGGDNNQIQEAGSATIGGGFNNAIWVGAMAATIGGGNGNMIQTNAYGATIGGGGYDGGPGGLNQIDPNSFDATIGGGTRNTIQDNGEYATIGGGRANVIGNSSYYAIIGGGSGNMIQSNANYATIPGGYRNIATNYAFAAGNQAQAIHTGAFVWADSTAATFSSIANDEFAVRAAGGVRFITGNPGLTVYGPVTAMAFNTSSDRNLKEHLGAVSPREILDQVASLPIWRWNFKADAGTPHIGPMAQDFYAAFNVGSDDRHIATVDADGVALAAIQGLNQKLEETRADNAALRADNADLRARLEKLERLLQPSN